MSTVPPGSSPDDPSDAEPSRTADLGVPDTAELDAEAPVSVSDTLPPSLSSTLSKRVGETLSGRGGTYPPDQTAAPISPTVTLDRGDSLAVTFFLLVFGICLFGMFNLFEGFWTDIVLALVFSALARKQFHRLTTEHRARPSVAAGVLCALVVVTVAIPLTFLIISLSAEAARAIELTRSTVSLNRLDEIFFGTGWVADQVRNISDIAGVEFTPQKLKQLVSGAAGALATLVYDGVNEVLTNVLSGIFHFCIMLALTYYLLVDGDRFRRFTFKLSPLPQNHEEELLGRFGDVGRAILFGNGIGSAIQGILGGLAMAAVGLPSPILWATVMTIFAFLPLVGISVVVIPATIYLALSGRYAAAIAFFGFCGGMALIVENVVKTRLMSQDMKVGDKKMHDMLVFMSVIGGIAAYGVLGILYGPLLVALFLTLADLYEREYKLRIKDPLSGATE